MTQDEKMTRLRTMLSPDTVSDDELSVLLEVTRGAILNQRYPFGYSDSLEVPRKYEHIQLLACVQLYNKKGAEGQTSHSENGITRQYDSGDISFTLLSKILPMSGSVSHEES